MEIKKLGRRGATQDLVCIVDGDFVQESRSYTCAFCKRGFSNAQALGGHMNVHRKDRARLQESIQDDQPPILTETTKGMNSMDQGEAQSSSDEKRPGSSRKKDDHDVHLKKAGLQLSLCIDSSDSCMISLNKISSLSPSSSKEVDLELRLGMDSEPTTRDRVIRE